ncbi:DnaJ domain-containing protein [Rufibacter sediminis]|uniref:DnaJ domain-containing protein n=1 Tax=Rufibacter sediminis TaxID=2762756 RepID=A0ABR6VQT8_9BACT|nr:DnaJ domain-containing protein [Rufibacter sediminis]MBC3539568.1 DnaJ domain-containing protein [Rufibacter sediminis]
MSKNYYHILGVSSSATSAEIKRAYKRLALKWHPDKNPHDSHAEERFKQVNDAYQVLSDPRRRAAFDLQQQYEQQRRQAQAYATPRYHHTRNPAGFTERHYRQRPKQHTHFSRRDLQIILGGIILTILLIIGINLGWGKIASGRAMTLARQAEQQRLWQKAAEAYSTALEYKPKLEEARVRRGALRLGYLKNPAGAIEDYTVALQENASPPAAWYAARGKGYLQTKHYLKAILDLDKALSLDQNLAGAYLDRGLAHLQWEDNWSAAAADLSNYLQNLPDSSALATEALLYRTFAYFRMQDWKKAWQDTEQALRQDASNAKAFYLQAKIKLAQGDSASGCRLLSKAAKLGFALAVDEVKDQCARLGLKTLKSKKSLKSR